MVAALTVSNPIVGALIVATLMICTIGSCIMLLHFVQSRHHHHAAAVYHGTPPPSENDNDSDDQRNVLQLQSPRPSGQPLALNHAAPAPGHSRLIWMPPTSLPSPLPSPPLMNHRLLQNRISVSVSAFFFLHFCNIILFFSFIFWFVWWGRGMYTHTHTHIQ